MRTAAIFGCFVAATACGASEPSHESSGTQTSGDSDETSTGSETDATWNDLGDDPPPLDECSVDLHLHLAAASDFDAAAGALVEQLDAEGISRAVLLPPPQIDGEGTLVTAQMLAAAAEGWSQRLSFGGGGGELSPLIHASAQSGAPPSAGELDLFEAKAHELADAGAVVFGEMAVLHLSFEPWHPYVEMPADHPMFLRLAEVAAARGLPIDLHMELLAEDSPPPPFFETPPDGNNPAVLPANLAAFELLLDHEPGATIVWVHVGWDNLGDATVPQLRALLVAHDNLRLQLKLLDDPSPVQVADNRPLDDAGVLRPEWLDLFEEFPSRFVLGADSFTAAPGDESPGEPSLAGTWALLDQLPPELARAFACTNPRAIYGRLPE